MIRKQSPLTAHLKGYSALAAAFLAIPAASDAQIVYTDIAPDTTFSAGTYNLDMDNDGTPDFVIAQFGSSYVQSVYLNPTVSNAFINKPVILSGTSSTYTLNSPEALAFGATIDASKNWQARNSSTSNYFAFGQNILSYPIGNWNNAGEAYAGLRFITGSNTYYGWVRMQIDPACTMVTIKDYAYYNSPNQPLQAGQTVATQVPGIKKVTGLFTLSRDNKLVALAIHQGNNSTIDVVNTLGQVVVSENTTQPNWQLNTEKYSSGMYFIRVRQGASVQTERFAVNN